jgi:hypothetical protein
MKTAELIGPALDWAVAKCEGNDYWHPETGPSCAEYSTDWAQGGPIIEWEGVTLDYDCDGQGLRLWTARKFAFDGTLLWVAFGPTPLIAAMRCYVASKLGDEIEIPEELLS